MRSSGQNATELFGEIEGRKKNRPPDPPSSRITEPLGGCYTHCNSLRNGGGEGIRAPCIRIQNGSFEPGVGWGVGWGEVIALCLKHLMTGQSEHYSNFLVIKRVIAAGGRL
jgi:hypothetical protein